MAIFSSSVAVSNAATVAAGQADFYQLAVDNLAYAGSHYLPYAYVNGNFVAPPGPQSGYIPRLLEQAASLDVVTDPLRTSITSTDPAAWGLHTAETFTGSFAYDAAGNPVSGTLSGLNVAQVLRVTSTDGINTWSDLNTFAAGSPEAALLADMQAQGGVFNAMSLSGANANVATLTAQAAAGDKAGALATLFAGNDTITGSTGSDTLFGYAGNDTLVGDDGNDILNPGTGTNRVDAGAGNDIIYSGEGTNGVQLTPANGIDGGAGLDTVVYAGSMYGYHIVTIAGSTPTTRVTSLDTSQTDVMVNVEKLQFDDGVIWLTPSADTAPTVSGTVTAATVEDGLPATLSLLANASDVDAGTVLSVVNLPAALPDGVSYSAATQTLTLDPTAAAYQSLAAGQATTVTIAYGVSDGLLTTAASAVFTITGTNDAAIIGGTATGGVTEDTTLTATGTLTVSDIDNGEAAFAAIITPLVGQYGSLLMDAAGNWTYTLNNASAAVQALNTGDVVTDTLTVHSLDGTAATLSIAVNGVTEPAFTLINGTSGNDTLNGTAGDDHIFGLGGKDTINAGAGNDLVDGGTGTDTLYGGTGNDRVVYDANDKLQDGGAGTDTLVLNGAAKVNLANTSDQVANDGACKTTGFENVDASGSAAAVQVTGSALANVLAGGAGNDMLFGNGGADMLIGNAGADSFVFKSTASNGSHIGDFVTGTDHLDLTALFNGSGSALGAHLAVQDTTAGTVISTDLGSPGTFSALVTLDGVHGASVSSLVNSGSLWF